MQDSATPPKKELDSPPEKVHDGSNATPAADSNDYVTGWKLTVVCVAVALACFLMLIDTMNISTVSELLPQSTYSHGIMKLSLS